MFTIPGDGKRVKCCSVSLNGKFPVGINRERRIQVADRVTMVFQDVVGHLGPDPRGTKNNHRPLGSNVGETILQVIHRNIYAAGYMPFLKFIGIADIKQSHGAGFSNHRLKISRQNNPGSGLGNINCFFSQRAACRRQAGIFPTIKTAFQKTNFFITPAEEYGGCLSLIGTIEDNRRLFVDRQLIPYGRESGKGRSHSPGQMPGHGHPRRPQVKNHQTVIA